MEYQPIIGLEVHIQLKTKSKMFCGCPNEPFGREPNTLTCPTCLGLPGALPVPNKKAIEDTILLGLALDCQINRDSYFERKNYFYPDLPKGYQISQYRQPLAVNGYLVIPNVVRNPATEGGTSLDSSSAGGRTQNDAKKKIRIRRVHLEEDTGKMIHPGGSSLIDFNRSGVPLVEIVSEPDFSSVAEVDTHLRQLQRMVRYLDISGADMEKGSMRLEPTVNLKISRDGKDYYTPLVEIKNINSFRFVRRALEFEMNRQLRVFRETGEEKKSGNKQTVGFSEARGETFLQREKEEAHDYRYFPEPDIPPLVVDDVWLASIKKRLPELPADRRERFIRLGLTPSLASLASVSRERADYFEGLVREGLEPTQAANLVVNKPEMWVGTDYHDLARQLKDSLAKVVSDERQLTAWVEEVLRENPAVVEQFRRGKKEVLQFLMGQVIKKSQGQAAPPVVKKILEKELES